MLASAAAALAAAGALAVSALACASTGAVPRPFPMPTPRDAASESPGGPPVPLPGPMTAAHIDAAAVVGTALDLRGIPYRNGGSDRRGFDCSGFTQYVFAQHNVWLPRAVRDQFRQGEPITTADLRPGDLLFFSAGAGDASHVAIAIGGDEFVHAPSTNGTVRVERLSSRYWARYFIGARRLD
jgi:cell wall-associated NlpC family hydrolase